MKCNNTKPLPYTRASWLLVLIIAVCFTTACNNAAREKREKDVDDFKAYVREHKDSADAYVDRQWAELEAEYNEKKVALEKDTAEMGEEFRAKYRESVNEWEEFKNDFTVRQQERAAVAEMDVLRAQLVITGVRNDFSDLSPASALQEYEHFVNTVKANKDAYTKEQWLVVNNSWKSLNGRKKEIEKDLPNGDGGKITKLQLEYTGIKAVNRPFAESES